MTPTEFKQELDKLTKEMVNEVTQRLTWVGNLHNEEDKYELLLGPILILEARMRNLINYHLDI